MFNTNKYFSLITDIRATVGARYWIYLCLLVMTGLFEGIGLVSMLPLLTGIGIGVADQNSGTVSNMVTKLLEAVGIEPSIEILTLFIVTTLFLAAVFFLLQAYLGAKLQTLYVYRWQKKLIKNIFLANWDFFQKQRRGEIINSIVSETQRLGGAFYQAGLLMTGVIYTFIYLVLAIFISPIITILILLLGLCLIFLTRKLIRRASIIGKGISLEGASLQATTVEMFTAAKYLKAESSEGEAISVLDGIADRLRIHFFSNAFDIQLAKGIFDFGTAVTIAVILYASYVFFSIQAALTVVVLAIFIRLMPKISGLQQSIQALNVSLPALDTNQKIFFAAKAAAEIVNTQALPDNLINKPISISIRNVSICRGNKSIFNNLNLTIPEGECLAIIGGSGSGKSTFVDAILGLVPIRFGEILLGGHKLSDLPLKSFRRRVGYMGQENILLNRTVYQNITWGRTNINLQMVNMALKASSALDFVNGLPDGMNTLVGNCGVALSGGEIQRISLARALIGDPGLLILDEATSALDADTELSVINSLKDFKGKKTILIIAHRLASIKIADRIVMLDNGEILESGSWDFLYEKKGAFRRLCDLQLGLDFNQGEKNY